MILQFSDKACIFPSWPRKQTRFFQNVQMLIKPKDYIEVNMEIRFKAVHIFKAAKTCDFY